MATTKSPTDDKPFDFNLDAFKAETELLPFRFHWNSKRWTMEHVEALDSWDLIAASSTRELDILIKVFEAALGDQYEEFRKIRLPQFKVKGLFDAYMSHCGVDPGESLGSTDS